jgi:hypothetical protein
MRLASYLNEGKNDYTLYHDSYTSAVQAALDLAKKQGYETNDDETFQLIGSGPRKPQGGKTNSLHIPLYKNGRPQRKMLHFQVYNRETSRNTYELNAYIS